MLAGILTDNGSFTHVQNVRSYQVSVVYNLQGYSTYSMKRPWNALIGRPEDVPMFEFRSNLDVLGMYDSDVHWSFYMDILWKSE